LCYNYFMGEDKEYRDKKEKKSFVDDDLQAVVAFLEGTSAKIIDSTRNVDNHTNVLLGLSMGVFALSINELMTASHLHMTLTAVAIFSGISSAVALLSIRPPRFLIKKGQEESLMYTRKIAAFKSHKEYAKALREILTSDEKIFHQYAKEIYNLSRFYYIPKRKMFSLSRNIFLFGVVAALFFMLLEIKFKLHLF
jgi:hypothetical protein